jgi:hypothetical protein
MCCQPDSAAELSVAHSQLMPSWQGMRAVLSYTVQLTISSDAL